MLKTKRAKLIGRTLRHNDLPSRIIESAVEGNYSRERPSLDCISKVFKDTEYKLYCGVKRRPKKREEWKIAAFCRVTKRKGRFSDVCEAIDTYESTLTHAQV